MPLQKQVVPIDFTKGLDKKSDPKLTIPGALEQLQNGQFDTSNTISKRPGYEAITANIFGGGAISTGKGITTRGDELLLRDNTKLYSKAPAVAAPWLDKGNVSQVSVDLTTVASGGHQKKSYDCASTDSMTCVVWNDVSTSAAYYTIIDDTTGARFVDNVSFAAAGLQPRVIAASSKFLLLYNDGAGHVKSRYVSTTTPTTISAATTVGNIQALSGHFDADYNTVESKVYVAFDNTAGPGTGLDIVACSMAGVVASTTNFPDLLCSSCIAVCIYASGDIGVAHSEAGTTYASIFSPLLIEPGTVTLDSSGQNVESMGGVQNGSNIFWVYERLQSPDNTPYNRLVGKEVSTTPAVVGGGLTLTVLGMNLATKPFAPGDGQVYVGGLFDTPLQPTVFILNATTSGNTCVAARILPGLSTRKESTYNRIGSVISRGSGNVSLPVGRKGRFEFFTSGNPNASGLGLANLAFTSFQPRSVEYQGSRVWSGGAPVMYDGVSAVEYGFHLYPELLVVSDLGAGVSSAGTYQFVVIYEWIDAQGVTHRSIPSPAESVTLAVSRQARIVFPALRLTKKTSPRSEVNAVIYSTTANGTIFYRAGTATNNPATDKLTFDTTLTDATLLEEEILYTTGGVLDNEPAPACKYLCIHQERLVAAGLEQPQEFRYSKMLALGDLSAFNDAMAGTVPPTHGKITGIASMDDKLILLLERGAYYVSGQGPVDTGQQNGYSDAQLITSDFGCSAAAPASVIVAPPGTFFLSDKGIRLIDRSLSVNPAFGAEVDTLATACVAALAAPSKSQLHFYVGTTVIVFDYLWNQWSTFSNHSAVDASIWASKIVHLTSAGIVEQHTTGLTTDNGSATALSVTTGWLKFAGIQGFQRVYRLLLVGTFRATSTLSIEVGYNYLDAWSTAVTITTGNVASSGVPIQLQHMVPTQKCESIRFRISETGGSGAGFSLSNMSLELGLKTGAYKLPSANRI